MSQVHPEIVQLWRKCCTAK